MSQPPYPKWVYDLVMTLVQSIEGDYDARIQFMHDMLPEPIRLIGRALGDYTQLQRQEATARAAGQPVTPVVALAQGLKVTSSDTQETPLPELPDHAPAS